MGFVHKGTDRGDDLVREKIPFLTVKNRSVRVGNPPWMTFRPGLAFGRFTYFSFTWSVGPSTS